MSRDGHIRVLFRQRHLPLISTRTNSSKELEEVASALVSPLHIQGKGLEISQVVTVPPVIFSQCH